MQTVKILGIQGSRKLKTYRSKNLVLLLDSGGKTNLETYIQGEYLSPSESGRTLSLSATDIIDTISATANAIISFNFNIAESIDTITADIENIVSSSLSVTGAIDTIESSAESIVSTELDTTDNIDTSEITAQLDRLITIEVTEPIDKAVIKVSSGQSNRIPSIGPAQLWSFLKRLRKPLNAKMKVSEAQDTTRVEAVLQYSAKIKASEQRDGIVFLTQNNNVIAAYISELQDTAFADHIEHKIKSDKIYSDYEAHEMAIFALAS